jgi:hypothetical protein
MSQLGHVPTFSTGRRRVCNAAVNRRSDPSTDLPKLNVRTRRTLTTGKAAPG